MKIGFTYNLENEYQRHEKDPPDAVWEFDREVTIEKIKNSLQKYGHQVELIGNVHNLLRQLPSLKNRVDIVFNIAEGLSGRNREAQIPLLLEIFGIPYVGSDALTQSLTLDKVMTKKILIAEKIPTPAFFQITNLDELKDIKSPSFPLIVKPRWEGSSKGISTLSRVNNIKELRNQAAHITNAYQQPALIEKFIQGTEYTVVIIGNEEVEIHEILQVNLGHHPQTGGEIFLGEFVNTDDVEYVLPQKMSAALKQQIKKLAIRTYRSVDCRDFGRVDIRVDNKGQPYVLEINPLPSLDELDAFSMLAQYSNLCYHEVIHKILETALHRYGLTD